MGKAAALGRVVRTGPAAKGIQISHPGGDANLRIADNDCAHGSVLNRDIITGDTDPDQHSYTTVAVSPVARSFSLSLLAPLAVYKNQSVPVSPYSWSIAASSCTVLALR